MEKVFLNRTDYQDRQTLGYLVYLNKEICKSLELAWNNNNSKISCIPIGEYKVIRRWSNKFNNHFYLTNVPGRDFILIHNANYHYQLLGCIAVGEKFVDLNKDGYLDVTNSVSTLKKLLKMLPNEFILEIC